MANPPSFFHRLKSRELHGGPVRRCPDIGELESGSGGFGAGVVAIEHEGVITPPLSLSFSKNRGGCHLLAVSDEDGYIGIYDTRLRLPSLASCRENAGKARICEWVAHQNAIFDICWIKDDTQILTASGDQSIKIWDIEKRKCLGSMMGHTGSVKSLSSHPSNPGLIVSGSRDGSFALWDMRCKPSLKTKQGEVCLTSTAVVKAAHVTIRRKKGRRGKVMQAANKSVTSVLYLNDEISVASAGAADSIVKFWDTRNLKSPYTQSGAQAKPLTTNEKGHHGISSLSQDSNGVFIAASCMDNRVYLHDVLRLEKGPIQAFSGSRIESFYVKAAISPDASYLLAGSSDGNAYMWKVDRPKENPVILKGHEGEVTAVSWCPSEMGKIATASDDFTMRIWNVSRSSSSFFSPKYHTSPRKRVFALPSEEGQRLMMNDPQLHYDGKKQEDTNEKPPSLHQSEVELRTPQSSRKKLRSSSFMMEDHQSDKLPDSTFESPSSVLNLPSSLKRKTIRDYFATMP